MTASFTIIRLANSSLLGITSTPRPGDRTIAAVISWGHGWARTADGRTFRVYADWTAQETSRSVRNHQS